MIRRPPRSPLFPSTTLFRSLLLTLAAGTGAGTAASERSWIAIGGVRLGQPAELAKLAVVLMLARWLAERREAPATLRELLRSEEHTSELQSLAYLVCRLLLE